MTKNVHFLVVPETQSVTRLLRVYLTYKTLNIIIIIFQRKLLKEKHIITHIIY